jgi:ABC-2 type transport system ATP-binding protein
VGQVSEVVARYVDAVNLGSSEVANRTRDRATGGEAEILDISLLSKGEERISRIASGDPVRVRISYRSERDLPQARFGLSLWTGEGVRIATFESAFAGEDLPLKNGEGFVDCVIPELALLPDRYLIRGGIYDGTTGWPIDRWGWEGGELSVLEIATTTRFSRDVVLTREHGILFIPASWES